MEQLHQQPKQVTKKTVPKKVRKGSVDMKNFSVPEKISSALELDELARLKYSLEKNISKELTKAL